MGTARYASINALAGIELTRRDDLESLAYVLVYFLRGSLPWQGISGDTKHKHTQVLEMKKMVSPKELCEGLPPQFETFLSYARTLEFSQKPNYQYLRDLLRGASSQSPKLMRKDVTLEQRSMVGQASSETDMTLVRWQNVASPQTKKWK